MPQNTLKIALVCFPFHGRVNFQRLKIVYKLEKKLKPLTIPIKGETAKTKDGIVLFIHQEDPEIVRHGTIYLRLAFVTKGKGGNVFPSFIIDDWGREIRGIKLYEWVRVNGEKFPRAEIFGQEADGRETQCFLREVELYARLPTYAYNDKMQNIPEGRLLHSILLATSTETVKKLIKPPEIKYPLKSARVNWWQVPIKERLEDVMLDNSFPDPGY